MKYYGSVYGLCCKKSFEAAILVVKVVEALTLPQFTRIWHAPFRFQLLERLRIGSIFIDVDDAWRGFVIFDPLTRNSFDQHEPILEALRRSGTT